MNGMGNGRFLLFAVVVVKQRFTRESIQMDEMDEMDEMDGMDKIKDKCGGSITSTSTSTSTSTKGHAGL